METLEHCRVHNSISMDETLRHDVPQVSEENEMLTVFDMEHNKAPGPDGFH